ncbi:BREX system P-loop protein BrxC [Parapusillimonas sp. JC17]|uniref:BREX system P-loop protein BrxC n=1 Tax=Parapusillimonas sp. JC17 TaxID=3445768 RepID=UPI003FA039E3
MHLKSIFSKPVDRPIEGVIKADDEASLRLEIEEYVLTNEIEKRLDELLAAYNNYTHANGVWISGFFGSGKSHLLKLLALLLENRSIDGANTLDLFLPKCGNNEMLRADLKKAVAVPSKSILFNIDQKAAIISKTEIDALLSVFVKVFDEMCGYYGNQGHIAQFERDLDSRGQYDAFRQAYETVAGKPWQKGREQALLESRNIAQAYAQATHSEADQALGILDKYRAQYRVSIEDFAEQVRHWVDKQGPNFRLNFFVDEVGQYIAENTKLMTNLQTIAESLATKCRGRAWIIVTAQEDMSTVLGEMSKRQENDFTKIQARFANRMKLTSQDVAEVIQKRLLAKTEAGTTQLAQIYLAQSNNFKTLFDFVDGSQHYQNFRDQEHFVNSYPFIPYQFALFQASIQNLSKQNAFEGKHSSVGERSMLGVFQQVVIQIREHDVGQLATFDRMFEGIRTALKSNIQRAILQAEQHLGDEFAVRLLKALFLVKYVKEFKPSLRNLCVLMLEGFEQDLPALRRRVEEALNLLESQTYIQRNGELYEFLSDEEKDIEQEIKNTDVDTTDVAEELQKVVFDQVLGQRKIRVNLGTSANQGQDYSFARRLDDRLHGRDHELSIHIISPFHEHVESEQMLRTASAYQMEALFVIMQPDEQLMRELLMYKKTERYIRQNISITQNETTKRILYDKGHQNQQREDRIRLLIHELIGSARLMIAGADVEVTSDEPVTRMTRGFHELVTRVYPNLSMLRGVNYTENDIRRCLDLTTDGIVGNDAATLPESEQEILAFIHGNQREGVRTTLKSVLERFERKPYGWYYAAILCLTANLWARGKLEARNDSNLLEIDALEQALRNTSIHGQLVLEPQIEFSASQVRALKEFHEEFFGPPSSSEAKALGRETSANAQRLAGEIKPLFSQVDRFPFLENLQPVHQTLLELAAKPYTWWLTELRKEEDKLLNQKEDVLDPILTFMRGSQKDIYLEASTLLKTQESNFHYLQSDTQIQIQAILDDPKCYRSNRMQQLKALVDALRAEVTAAVQHATQQALAKLNGLQTRLQGMDEYQALPTQRQAELDQPFQELHQYVSQESLIAALNDRLHTFEEQGYATLLTRTAALALQAREPEPVPAGHTNNGNDATPGDPQPPAPAPKIVPARSLKPDYPKAWLASENDIDNYLDALRKTLLAEVQQGHKVQI